MILNRMFFCRQPEMMCTDENLYRSWYYAVALGPCFDNDIMIRMMNMTLMMVMLMMVMMMRLMMMMIMMLMMLLI